MPTKSEFTTEWVLGIHPDSNLISIVAKAKAIAKVRPAQSADGDSMDATSPNRQDRGTRK